MKKKQLLYLILILGIALAGIGWYFFSEKQYFAKIPIGFFSSFGKTPYTEAEIEGSIYRIEIDTGAVDSGFILKKEILEKIDKKFVGTSKWMDMRGNEYEVQRYIVPKIKFKKGIFSDVEAKEESIDFLTTGGAFWGNQYQPERANRHDGRVGLGILRKVNWFFDFSNSVIFASNNIRNLKKEGYRIENLIKVPFELNRYGIILIVNTDIGSVKLVLDTGTSSTLIQSSLIKEEFCKGCKLKGKTFKNSKFIIGNMDFGSQDLYPIELSEKLKGFDGAIGMDFLRNHVIYLDFKNKFIYIGKNSEVVPKVKA